MLSSSNLTLSGIDVAVPIVQKMPVLYGTDMLPNNAAPKTNNLPSSDPRFAQTTVGTVNDPNQPESGNGGKIVNANWFLIAAAIVIGVFVYREVR